MRKTVHPIKKYFKRMASGKNNTAMILRIKNMIQDNQTMTLATSGNNSAWAAPVFYVNIGACFYFFSNPDSRHIKEARVSDQAACSIYADDASWQNLMGLQMSGKILIVPGSVEASNAVLAYIKKFHIVKTFFVGIKTIGLTDFSNKFNAKLYCFSPESISFMDNSVQFGFCKEIDKDTLFK